MGFFILDPSLENAVKNSESQTEIKLEIETRSGGVAVVMPCMILDGYFHSSFDSFSGIVSRAHVIFYAESVSPESLKHDGEVKVFFTSGTCGRFLHRFTMYPDERGFCLIREGGRKELIAATLEDYPARLKRIGAVRDWLNIEVLVDCVISDKGNPDKSILHRIALKGGIGEDEIDCVNVGIMLEYVRISKNPWEEITSLAESCFAIAEGGTDRKIVFTSSPYQDGGIPEEEITTFEKTLFYYIGCSQAGDLFFNDIRLKWNKPERLERQIIWKYSDPPAAYDELLRPVFYFKKEGEKREIELKERPYYARYSIEGDEGKVVYADELEGREEIEEGMEYVGGEITVSDYDVSSFTDRAVIHVECVSDSALRKLEIKGRPIILRSNFCCYRRDEESITGNGMRIKNCTGKYFAGHETDGKKHYEDWTDKMLELAKIKRKRFAVKSEYGLFYTRTGSLVRFMYHAEKATICRVERMTMRYRKGKSFEVSMELIEEVD